MHASFLSVVFSSQALSRRSAPAFHRAAPTTLCSAHARAIYQRHVCHRGGHGVVTSPQVKKALIASGVSLVFTVVVTFLAFAKMEDMENGTSRYKIPVRAENVSSVFSFFFNCRKEKLFVLLRRREIVCWFSMAKKRGATRRRVAPLRSLFSSGKPTRRPPNICQGGGGKSTENTEPPPPHKLKSPPHTRRLQATVSFFCQFFHSLECPGAYIHGLLASGEKLFQEHAAV